MKIIDAVVIRLDLSQGPRDRSNLIKETLRAGHTVPQMRNWINLVSAANGEQQSPRLCPNTIDVVFNDDQTRNGR